MPSYLLHSLVQKEEASSLVTKFRSRFLIIYNTLFRNKIIFVFEGSISQYSIQHTVQCTVHIWGEYAIYCTIYRYSTVCTYYAEEEYYPSVVVLILSVLRINWLSHTYPIQSNTPTPLSRRPTPLLIHPSPLSLSPTPYASPHLAIRLTPCT